MKSFNLGGRSYAKASKYHNKRTEMNDRKYDSKKEALRAAELELEQRIGEISQLEMQPAFRLEVQGVLICRYKADFMYKRKGDKHYTVEDSKGMRTKDYIIKAKLFQALYPQHEFIES